MKQNKNIFPSLGIAAALLIATMFASCTKAELEAPVVKQGAEIRFGIEKKGISKPITKSGSKSDSRVLVDYDPNDPCSLGLSMTVVDGIETPKSHLPATKGAQVSQKEQLTAFDVVSYFYADEAAEDGAFVFEDIVSDGVNTTKTYYWPSFGEMNFIATYPAGMFGEDGIKSIADAYGHLQSFSYTIPETVANQQDIMIAVTNDVDCTEGAPVPLQFKHLLAAVQFKVGDMMLIKINSLSINGVKGGDVTIQYGENGWSYNSSTTTKYDVIYSTNNEPNFDTSGLPTGSYIAGNDNGLTMFVMPQELGGAQSITINYTELATGEPESKTIKFEGNLAHSWQAGKTTTYVLNIGTTVDIEIPTPPDADAHYVRVDMPYNFTQLAQKGFKNFKATAYWENDGNNDASSDKQDITLNTSLSETQIKGFFTDEQRKLEYEVVEGGYKVSGSNVVVSELPEPTFVKSIIGTHEISLTNNSGTVYLFLDENNGTKDRNGVLKVTGEITENGKSTTIIIGMGRFKQLCPSWNNNIGVERFEDVNEGVVMQYPYGFGYNRKVTYTNSLATKNWGWLDWLRELILMFWGTTAEEILPDGVNIAEGFVTIRTVTVGGREVVSSVILDYSALNKVSNVANSTDGLLNTKALYNFTGDTDLNELETTLNANLSSWNPKVDNATTDAQPEDYAAFVALSRNRMYELQTIIHGKDELQRPTTTTTYKAILHKDAIGNDIIEWYLPSSEEAKVLKETGTGSERTPISILDGEYWSSSAGNDSNAYAHSFTYNNGTFVSVDQQKPRMDKIKVRAVRKKPTAN